MSDVGGKRTFALVQLGVCIVSGGWDQPVCCEAPTCERKGDFIIATDRATRHLRLVKRGQSLSKSILLTARALACGVFVAVVTVSAYAWADEMLRDSYPILSPEEAARVAVFFSAKAALQVLLVCVPLWLLLDRLVWTSWAVAAALGFIAPLVWLCFNAWTLGQERPWLELTSDSLPLAICGAFAGLAVWMARPRVRRMTEPPSN